MSHPHIRSTKTTSSLHWRQVAPGGDCSEVQGNQSQRRHGYHVWERVYINITTTLIPCYMVGKHIGKKSIWQLVLVGNPGGKASHAERWQLFEEFCQSKEDWSSSTLLASIRATRDHERRGQYRAMSRSEPYIKFALQMYHNTKPTYIKIDRYRSWSFWGPPQEIPWWWEVGGRCDRIKGPHGKCYIYYIFMSLFLKYCQEKDGQYSKNPDAPATRLH